MTRRIALILAVVMLMAVVFPASSLARGNSSYGRHEYGWVAARHISGSVRKIAMSVEGDGSGWFNAIKLALVKMLVAAANAEIESLVEYAQRTPQNDIDWLLDQVDQIVARVHREAAFLGFEIECSYTEYYIDGEYVLVDPLKVINVGGDE